jgi:hypothetical protein
MIKYFILTTSLFTLTYLDGYVSIYIAEKAFDFSQLHYTLNTQINNIHCYSFPNCTPFTLGYPTLNLPPTTLVNFINNHNYLIPLYERSNDIINNIGRRPNLFIIPYHELLNNVPLILAPSLLLLTHLYNLLYNLIINAKPCKAKGLALVVDYLFKPVYRLNEKFKHPLQDFMRNLKFNYVSEHLRNYTVYSMRRIVYVNQEQISNAALDALIRQREHTYSNIRRTSRRINGYVNNLASLLRENQITIYEGPLQEDRFGRITVEGPSNMDPLQLSRIRQRVRGLYNNIRSNMHILLQHNSLLERVETRLMNGGANLDTALEVTPFLRLAGSATALFYTLLTPRNQTR